MDESTIVFEHFPHWVRVLVVVRELEFEVAVEEVHVFLEALLPFGIDGCIYFVHEVHELLSELVLQVCLHIWKLFNVC